MLNDEICKLRDKLNESIEQEKDYTIIYGLSIELDELIAKYYENTSHNAKNCKVKRNIKRNNIELTSKT